MHTDDLEVTLSVKSDATVNQLLEAKSTAEKLIKLLSELIEMKV